MTKFQWRDRDYKTKASLIRGVKHHLSIFYPVAKVCVNNAGMKVTYRGGATSSYCLHQNTDESMIIDSFPKTGMLANQPHYNKPTYPELREVARSIADDTCRTINRKVKTIESEIPYKEQFILECVIDILSKRV